MPDLSLLGTCAQNDQPTEPLFPSPLLKGNMHATGVTGPMHGPPPPLILLVSQDLCVGEIMEEDAMQRFTQSLGTWLKFAYQWEPLNRNMLEHYDLPKQTLAWLFCGSEPLGTQSLPPSALLCLQSPLFQKTAILPVCTQREVL